jgi:hypothetical protein
MGPEEEELMRAAAYLGLMFFGIGVVLFIALNQVIFNRVEYMTCVAGGVIIGCSIFFYNLLAPDERRIATTSGYWEYASRVIPAYSAEDLEHISDLNELGAERWELCSVVREGDDLRLWFRRRIKGKE